MRRTIALGVERVNDDCDWSTRGADSRRRDSARVDQWPGSRGQHQRFKLLGDAGEIVRLHARSRIVVRRVDPSALACARSTVDAAHPYGEIMPEDHLYGVMKALSAFDLKCLEESFAARQREKLVKHSCLTARDLKNLEKGPPV